MQIKTWKISTDSYFKILKIIYKFMKEVAYKGSLLTDVLQNIISERTFKTKKRIYGKNPEGKNLLTTEAETSLNRSRLNLGKTKSNSSKLK